MAFLNGCNESGATLLNYPCSQPPPAPLPSNFPATAVSFAFPGTGFATTGAVSNVGEALELVDSFLGCLPDVCNLPTSSVLVAGPDGRLAATDLTQALRDELLGLIPNAGQHLINLGGVVVANDFGTDVEAALAQLLPAPGQILVGSGPNGVVARNLCTEVNTCLSNSSVPNEFFLNVAGTVTGVNFASAVGGALANAPQFCPEVYSCIANAVQPGEVLINQGGGITGTNLNTAIDNFIATSAAFCNRVSSCLLGQLNLNSVLVNQGGTLTSVNIDQLVAQSIQSPAVAGVFCTEVLDCLDSNSNSGDFFLNTGGNVQPTNFEAEVTSIVNALGGVGNNFDCTDVTDCLGGALGTGQVYFNNGVGTQPTDLAAIVAPVTQDRQVYQVEFARVGALAVSGPAPDQPAHVPLPATVLSNRSIAGLTYTIQGGGNVNLALDVGGTVTNYTNVNGSGSLTPPPAALVGDPEISLRVTAVNSPGSDLSLSMFIRGELV